MSLIVANKPISNAHIENIDTHLAITGQTLNTSRRRADETSVEPFEQPVNIRARPSNRYRFRDLIASFLTIYQATAEFGNRTHLSS